MTESAFKVLSYVKAIPEFSWKDGAQKLVKLVDLFNTEVPENKKATFFALVIIQKFVTELKQNLK